MSFIPRAVPVLAILLLATGCASPAEPAVSLADSKSATQLLRLDTSTRIPAEFISEMVRPNDVAEPCDEGDPHLRWVSSASARFTSEHAGDVKSVYRDLVDGFVERGWHREVVSDTEAVLSSTKSIATVTLTARVDTVPASVDILAVGPCVETAGLGSAEVDVLVRS